MADTSRLPGPHADQWNWQVRGSCRGADPAMCFHPEGERGPRRDARESAAKAVCGACPVRERCANYALATQEPYGIWGGMSEHERERILSKRRVRIPTRTVVA